MSTSKAAAAASIPGVSEQEMSAFLREDQQARNASLSSALGHPTRPLPSSAPIAPAAENALPWNRLEQGWSEVKRKVSRSHNRHKSLPASSARPLPSTLSGMPPFSVPYAPGALSRGYLTEITEGALPLSSPPSLLPLPVSFPALSPVSSCSTGSVSLMPEQRDKRKPNWLSSFSPARELAPHPVYTCPSSTLPLRDPEGLQSVFPSSGVTLRDPRGLQAACPSSTLSLRDPEGLQSVFPSSGGTLQDPRGLQAACPPSALSLRDPEGLQNTFAPSVLSLRDPEGLQNTFVPSVLSLRDPEGLQNTFAPSVLSLRDPEGLQNAFTPSNSTPRGPRGPQTTYPSRKAVPRDPRGLRVVENVPSNQQNPEGQRYQEDVLPAKHKRPRVPWPEGHRALQQRDISFGKKVLTYSTHSASSLLQHLPTGTYQHVFPGFYPFKGSAVIVRLEGPGVPIASTPCTPMRSHARGSHVENISETDGSIELIEPLHLQHYFSSLPSSYSGTSALPSRAEGAADGSVANAMLARPVPFLTLAGKNDMAMEELVQPPSTVRISEPPLRVAHQLFPPAPPLTGNKRREPEPSDLYDFLTPEELEESDKAFQEMMDSQSAYVHLKDRLVSLRDKLELIKDGVSFTEICNELQQLKIDYPDMTSDQRQECKQLQERIISRNSIYTRQRRRFSASHFMRNDDITSDIGLVGCGLQEAWHLAKAVDNYRWTSLKNRTKASKNRVQTRLCYLCRGYGHLAAACEGPERRDGCK